MKNNGTSVFISNQDALLLYAALAEYQEKSESDMCLFDEVVKDNHQVTDNYLDCVCDAVRATDLKQRIALIFGIKEQT